MPTDDVVEIAQKKGVTHLFTSVTLKMPDGFVSNLFEHLTHKLKGIPILATGHLIEVNVNDMPSNVFSIGSAQRFRDRFTSK